MLHLKENIKPHLKKCEFNCDKPLHPKLDKFELLKLMNCHSSNILIGKPKSGKTNLLYSLLASKECFKKVFDNIFVFQPVSSQQSMKDNIFQTLPSNKLFGELSFENLSNVLDQIHKGEKEHNNCIVIDDMGAYLKNNDILHLLKTIMQNKRHLHISIFFLCQTWKSVDKDMRKLFDNLFIFKVSKEELETIFLEIIEQKKNMVLPISKFVYDKPYNYLYINTSSQRMFKNFDEILIDHE